jgi:hypothetical protein
MLMRIRMEHWWNDTDRGKLSMEHWWNDTDRKNRVWSIGGMTLTGETEYGALVESY